MFSLILIYEESVEIVARDRREGRKGISEKRNQLRGADITIKNNTMGGIVLKSDINGGSIYHLQEYGEVEEISFAELQSIVKKLKKLFDDCAILIDDVYSPTNDELTIEDVEEVLGIKHRNMKEIPDEYYCDELLLDLSFDEFEDEIKGLDNASILRLIEKAIILYKEGEFSNFNKMSLLEKRANIEYVFEDVSRSMKDIRNDIDLL